MITPYGRCRWARLPFVFNLSNEIFQRKLNEALERLDGTFTLADDIIIAGQGETEEEAFDDNKSKLQKVTDRCKERNVMLNADKIVVGLKVISFHGYTINSVGIIADTPQQNSCDSGNDPTK